jgi:hypothetical protein
VNNFRMAQVSQRKSIPVLVRSPIRLCEGDYYRGTPAFIRECGSSCFPFFAGTTNPVEKT